MCKFAHTTYEKILTDLLSFLRGLSFNDMWPLWDEYKKKCNKIFIQQ